LQHAAASPVNPLIETQIGGVLPGSVFRLIRMASSF